MKGKRVSKGARVSFSAWILVALMTTGLAISGANAYAQPGCFHQCQQALSQCLQGAQGNQMLQALCQDSYDSCGEQCQGIIRK